MDTIYSFDLKDEHLVAVVSDIAASMTAAGRAGISLISPISPISIS
jgi:hypothetical protein